MIDGEQIDTLDPADQLRADIESAIEGQHKEPASSSDKPESVVEPQSTDEPASREDGRDEKGRFVARTETEEGAKPAEEPKDAKVEPAPVEEGKPAVRPPPGFSVASKAIWETLPQSVRDDIAKREVDIESGLKRYTGLAKFAEEAERNGTTLQNAVNDYVAVEGALRQNFVGGIEFICQRMNIHPGMLAQHMAAKYLGQQAGAQPTQTTAAPQAPPPIDTETMTRQFTQIARAEAERAASSVKAEAERREIDSRIASFSADPKNKFFQNVRQDMAAVVQSGKAETIEQAYEAACWLNPEIRAILINEANGGRNKQAEVAASKARNAAKAVGGSPAPGVNPDVTGKRQDLSLEEEIRANVDAQSGAA